MAASEVAARILKNCARCEVEFQPSQRTQRFCSAQCRDTLWNTVRKESRAATSVAAVDPFILSVEQAAWLAGFVDGEGYIGISTKTVKGKRYYAATMQITNTYRPVLEYAAEMVVGNCCIKDGWNHKVNPKAKQNWQFWVNRRAIPLLLKQIRPYLRVKHKQADLLLAFCKTQKEMGFPAPRDLYEQFYLEMRALNKRGA